MSIDEDHLVSEEHYGDAHDDKSHQVGTEESTLRIEAHRWK
jgi:hypothetical protein